MHNPDFNNRSEAQDLGPQWAPKVHPATRALEPEDPLEFFAAQVPGDPELMLRCTVEEYARQGWSGAEILSLFSDPNYPALQQLARQLGPDRVKQCVAQVLGECGAFKVKVQEYHDELSCVPQCELVQLQIKGES